MNHKIRNAAIALVVLALLAICTMAADVQFRYLSRIHDPEEIPSLGHEPVAIVLGASVSNGAPSDALRDRLIVGAQLYKTKTVDGVFLTGDDGEFHADEVDVMKKYMENQGIPDAAITVDDRGFRTYESCKRAKETFHIDHAIIVTQRFHIARAVYLCNRLGIDSEGVTSDLQHYVRITYFWARDLAASVKAWIDINLLPPQSPVPAV